MIILDEVVLKEGEDMTLDKLRSKLQDIINKEGMPVILLAEEIGMDRFALGEFLKGKRQPRYETILKMQKYLEKRKKK